MTNRKRAEDLVRYISNDYDIGEIVYAEGVLDAAERRALRRAARWFRVNSGDNRFADVRLLEMAREVGS